MALVIDGRIPRKRHNTQSDSNQVKLPTILCVDDDPGVQTAIELRLRDYGVKVQHAFYGMQGIWESIRGKPDLVLLDVAMPNGDGRYVIRCLRANKDTACTPIIVLTGMRDPRLAREIVMAGADRYLHKPVSGDELIAEIKRFVKLEKKRE